MYTNYQKIYIYLLYRLLNQGVYISYISYIFQHILNYKIYYII